MLGGQGELNIESKSTLGEWVLGSGKAEPAGLQPTSVVHALGCWPLTVGVSSLASTGAKGLIRFKRFLGISNTGLAPWKR